MSKKNNAQRQLARQNQQRQQQQQQGVAASAYFVAQNYRGPLPPPSMLAEYDGLFPGCAERIVSMSESNTRHRHELERAVVLGNVAAQARGQWMAFGTSLVAVGAGITFVAMGITAAGVATILTQTVALAGVFIWGRRRQEKERKEKMAPFSGGELIP